MTVALAIGAAVIGGLLFFLGYIVGDARAWYEYQILYHANAFTRKERKQVVAEAIRRRTEAE